MSARNRAHPWFRQPIHERYERACAEFRAKQAEAAEARLATSVLTPPLGEVAIFKGGTFRIVAPRSTPERLVLAPPDARRF